MGKGRHWVLVVRPKFKITHLADSSDATQVLLLGNVVRPFFSHLSFLSTYSATVTQIVNESLPIFLDSAVRRAFSHASSPPLAQI